MKSMIGKQEETGFDPEEVFNEGVQYQQQQDDTQLREQIAEQLISQDFDPDEVEELLFDPAPRRGRGRGRRSRSRGGKRRCSAKQWAKMPQICRGQGGAKVRTARHPVMVYDPAPRGGYRAAAGRYYKKKGGAKGLIAGLRPLIGPGVLLGTVYSKYTERAAVLKAAGAQLDGKLVDNPISALMYDLKNRPTTSMMDRVKENAGKILTPVIIGVAGKYAAKKVKLHPKVNQAAGIIAEGLVYNGIGHFVNAILDPPNPAPVARPAIEVRQPLQATAPAQMTYGANPTGGF